MTVKGVLSILFVLICINTYGQKKKQQKPQHRVIAIGSYNCENFFDIVHDTTKKDDEFTPNGEYHYTAEVYKQKVHNIATVVEKMGTDVTPDGAAILGLVEVENDSVLKDLVAQPEIKQRAYKYIWFPTPDDRGISTAMLYNPKYFELLSARPLHVPLESLGQKRHTRDILFVSGVLAGDTIYILVNHWPSKSGGEAASAPGRRLAATIDKKIVDSLIEKNPNTKLLIMGDFNDNPTSEGISVVLDCKEDKAEVKLKDIYNPWTSMYRKGMGTENFQGEWNMIDQIMLSGSFLKNNNKKWKFYNNEIYNREFLINKIGKDKGLPHRSFTIGSAWDNGYSDHFPVLVYLVD